MGAVQIQHLWYTVLHDIVNSAFSIAVSFRTGIRLET